MLITIVYAHTTYISDLGFIVHYDRFAPIYCFTTEILSSFLVWCILYSVYIIFNKHILRYYNRIQSIISDNVMMWWSVLFVVFF